MWSAIATVLVALLKWVFQMQENKKLNDQDFLAHIETHQKRRQGAGQTAVDFEDAMKEAEASLGDKSPTDQGKVG